MQRCVFVCLLFYSLTIAAHAAPQYHHPEQFLASLAGKNETVVGKTIYSHYCAMCHAKKAKIPLGAPRLGVKADWQARLEQRTALQMLKKIDPGFNAMPPRGGCFECSDKQLLAAIHYLLPKKKEIHHETTSTEKQA